MNNSPKTKDCKFCGNPIPLARRGGAKYCSQECSQKEQRMKYRQLNPRPANLSTSTIGILSEYRVIIDLLQRGYEVFHAASPSTSCDLAILKNGRLFRVEVKTGHLSSQGKIYKNSVKARAKIRADILATVMLNGIIYNPPLKL